MIMKLLNFILPSQAGSAITFDGSAIIVLGAIIIGYYIIKNKNSILEVSPLLNSMENIESENKVENIKSVKTENSENIFNQTTLQTNAGENDNHMEENYMKNNEKEVIFNRR